nr:N-acetylglucosaminyltransferase [Azorhizobium caulinodans ORS 571]
MSVVDVIGLLATAAYVTLASAYKVVQFINVSSVTDVAGLESDALPLTPRVDVIVPTFNENSSTLLECVASICAQDYRGPITIVVVDDGSTNKTSFHAVCDKYASDERFIFVELDQNKGTAAQMEAIRRTDGDLILNVDSDTVIDKDVVTKLASSMRAPNVGGVMGQLVAKNRERSWLTRLIDMEYWLACNEERIAQSRFGSVMCCCGPCAMYRRSAITPLLAEYEHQTFLGRPSNFGEDRHLTILMLKAGFRTGYVPSAVARTLVPDGSPYLRQQLRWARSTYRDTALALRIKKNLSKYITFEICAQNLGTALLLVMTMISLSLTTSGSQTPVIILGVVVGMSIIRCCSVALIAKDFRFLYFIVHSALNVLILTPLKLYALLTIRDSRWLSRESS